MHHYDVLIFSGPIPVSLTFTSCFASQHQPATFKQEWLEGEITINYLSDQDNIRAEDRRRENESHSTSVAKHISYLSDDTILINTKV